VDGRWRQKEDLDFEFLKIREGKSQEKTEKGNFLRGSIAMVSPHLDILFVNEIFVSGLESFIKN